jgi:fructokinase
MAFTRDGDFAQVEPSAQMNVVDTVGAGDAFTSILILGLARQWPLELTMQRAQEFASLMVTQQGATVHSHDFYQAKIDDWGL